ncbi:YceI family protein [Fulvivirgaceae bacterium BMA12]|uniref:YceI family protein n=1 Tax=Agaribacillus aureus TaxID=3051825 RepID=A0ABT8L7X1_9BACT|nr:YceI family protein [Fulvivirgaceae bacterium BMA12]
MKKINLIILSVLFIAVGSAFTFSQFNTPTPSNNDDLVEIEAGAYNVDTKATTVGWIGRKIAYSHNGTVGLANGVLEFSDSGLSGGSFKLDMNSIKNIDLTDQKKNAKLVGHLKSADFFSVKDHPTVSFKITSVEKKADGDNNYKISGDLTIKGITHPLSFPAKIQSKGGEVTASAKMTFDRAKYNVKFQSGSFFENLGDKAIYDDVEMEVSLVARK